MHKKNNLNLILCVILLGVILLSLGFIILQKEKNTSSLYEARIYQNGNLIATYTLTPALSKTFVVEDGKGGYNTICIKEGGIFVEAANCPNQICVHQGEIRNSLLPITCIPHGLVIELYSLDKETTDALTY